MGWLVTCIYFQFFILIYFNFSFCIVIIIYFLEHMAVVTEPNGGTKLVFFRKLNTIFDRICTPGKKNKNVQTELLISM
jgi:hypothetical protein